MSEYVCELPFDDVVSFGSGNIQITVRERITRCGDCVFFEPVVADVAIDWCSCGDGHGTTPQDFCSLAEPIEEACDADGAR